MREKICPCGSKQLLMECCGALISGDKVADTPLKLMRSRYTAFVLANMAYIKKTMKGPALKGFNKTESKKWAESVEWLGLEVIKTDYQLGNTTGHVEFIATFKENHQVKSIHEKSKFIFENGKWYYVDGIHFSGT